MTPILQRMVDDMKLRNLAAKTQHSYVERVSMFSRYFVIRRLASPRDTRLDRISWASLRRFPELPEPQFLEIGRSWTCGPTPLIFQ